MKHFLNILFLLLSFSLSAQDVPMADEMRANGKIYVVVAVLVTILLGMIIYLISIDRKLKKLEKEQKTKS
ncbi:MAG: CcmD family protein [Flavobacteriales bacterium]|nr:CcmD family protein [Flavobacteriales bacterium]|tara:strand:+ start:42519 stop:42728 length:210 start_codon:yes stop_codon:yes gene_type:complete